MAQNCTSKIKINVRNKRKDTGVVAGESEEAQGSASPTPRGDDGSKRILPDSSELSSVHSPTMEKQQVMREPELHGHSVGSELHGRHSSASTGGLSRRATGRVHQFQEAAH